MGGTGRLGRARGGPDLGEDPAVGVDEADLDRPLSLGGWDSQGHESIGPFARVFTEAGGQIIQEIYPPLGAPDFAPYLAQVRQDADVVSVFFSGADAIRFVKQYAEYGLKGKIPLIGKGSITDEVILPSQGDAALGIVSTLQWSATLDTPANRRFISAYSARYKRLPTQFAEQAYVGAQMIAQALDAIKGAAEGRIRFKDSSFPPHIQTTDTQLIERF